MKYVAHYLLLSLVVLFGFSYWTVTIQSWTRHDIEGIELMIYDPEAGVPSILLHPFFSYLVLVMCGALVVKEFFPLRLRSRFLMNLGGFVVVWSFIAVLRIWMWNRGLG